MRQFLLCKVPQIQSKGPRRQNTEEFDFTRYEWINLSLVVGQETLHAATAAVYIAESRETSYCRVPPNSKEQRGLDYDCIVLSGCIPPHIPLVLGSRGIRSNLLLDRQFIFRVAPTEQFPTL